MHERKALVFVVGLSLGCGSSSSAPPADFTGQYTGTSIDGASTCPGTWTMGNTAQGQFNVVQSGDDVTFEAQGGAAVTFLLIFGRASLTGKAAGNHVDAAIVGSVANMAGACSYTYKGTLDGNLVGDKLDGTLTQTPTTNANADCDTQRVTGCSRLTTFSYTRPMK